MAPPELQAFGLAVRRARQRLGLSQEALALVAGLHRTYVGGVERGERNLGLLNVFALSRALRVSVTELMADAEEHLQR